MSSAKHFTEVLIGGKVYTLSGFEGEEYLRRKFIALNANLPYEAQKIVVCHELGHAILHKGYGYYLHADMNYYVPSRREKEANQFAIHLLSHSSDLDADLITKVISEKDPDPREVHRILSTLL